MKRLFGFPIFFLLLFIGNHSIGQKIYLLNGNDTLSKKPNEISIGLVQSDTIINLQLGQNNFKKFNPDKCKSIQLVYNTDTLYFAEKRTFAPNTPKVLLDIMSKDNPNYKLILSKNWTIIIDKVPVQNKELQKQIQKDIKDGTKILALKTDKLLWVILDKNYSEYQ